MRKYLLSVLCIILCLVCVALLAGCSIGSPFSGKADAGQSSTGGSISGIKKDSDKSGSNSSLEGKEKKATPTATPEPTPKPLPVTVTTDKKMDIYTYTNHMGDTAYYDFDCESPLFTYNRPGYTEQQDKLNSYFTALRDEADLAKTDTKTVYTPSDAEHFEQYAGNIGSFTRSDVTFRYKTGQLTEEFCSIKTWVSIFYAGAVHNFTSSNGHVIDLKSGKILAMSDLFDRTDDFITYLATCIYHEYYAENSTLQGWNIKTLTEQIDPKAGGNWYIKDDKLFIDYQEYALECYAAGSQTVGIPLDICSDYWTDTAARFFSHITPKPAVRY